MRFWFPEYLADFDFQVELQIEFSADAGKISSGAGRRRDRIFLPGFAIPATGISLQKSKSARKADCRATQPGHTDHQPEGERPQGQPAEGRQGQHKIRGGKKPAAPDRGVKGRQK